VWVVGKSAQEGKVMGRNIRATLAPFLASFIALFIAATPLRAALVDPIPEKIGNSSVTVKLTPITHDVASPVYLTTPNDNSGRLFVVDQPGVVKVIQNGAAQATPFIDVRSDLPTLGTRYDERGLLGLAFDPSFATNGKVYTYHTAPAGSGTADFPDPFLQAGQTPDHQGVITQWTVDPANPNQVNPTSRKEILRWDHPNSNHNGGTVAFGPDGMLYVSIGDGGGADDQNGQSGSIGKAPEGNAQNKTVILGKILRIDVNGTNSTNGKYGIPADNPFVSGANGEAKEIYAYGLRNPYRFSFDTATGRLISSDAGQKSIEEIDDITNGGNYGWHIKEGSFTFDPLDTTEEGVVTADSPGVPAGLIDPILQYDHDEGEATVGGFVYHGTKIPELQGKYIFGDFTKDEEVAEGELWVGDLDTHVIQRLLTDHGNPLDNLAIKGFGQDASGEIYVLTGGIGPTAGGEVFALDASGGPQPPPSGIPLPAPLLLGFAGMTAAGIARRWMRI
jgi:glucose/arabinose dehydrogenase